MDYQYCWWCEEEDELFPVNCAWGDKRWFCQKCLPKDSEYYIERPTLRKPCQQCGIEPFVYSLPFFKSYDGKKMIDISRNMMYRHLVCRGCYERLQGFSE